MKQKKAMVAWDMVILGIMALIVILLIIVVAAKSKGGFSNVFSGLKNIFG